MRAGRLDRTITIQRSSYIIDEAGSPIYTWEDLATPRAEVVQSSTEEFMRTYGASDEAIVIFRVRFISGVSTADRILFEDRHHNIKEVTEIGRRKGLELRAVAVSGT